MDREFIEKYIDNMQPGSDTEIKKYLSFGWFIYYPGLTCTILRKYI